MLRRLVQEATLANNDGSGSPTARTQLSRALMRLRTDLANIQGLPAVQYDPADPYEVLVTVRPSSGVWQGGVFNFVLRITDDFPFVGPKIRYKGPCRIFHPNIEGEEGQSDWGVCLGLQTDWVPAYTIRDLAFGLESLFTNPTYEDPLPGVAKTAAQMLKDHPDTFQRTARAWMVGHYL